MYGCVSGSLRITNGTVTADRNNYKVAGGLQFCLQDKWATVCQLNWNSQDGIVACRQLGLAFGGSKLINRSGIPLI